MLGHVEQVIINGVNHLVTAILVDGMFSEPRGNRMRWFLDEVIRQRKVVIPVHTIQHMTDTAVFLEVAASQFEDLDPASFVPLDTNWQPPYPYHPEHVLLSKPAESLQSNPHMAKMRQISKVLAYNERGSAINV